MTDADVDGEHIETLILTFFYRHLPEIIKQGYLYIAQPPLFKITIGKNSSYAYSDLERDDILKKNGKMSDDALEKAVEVEADGEVEAEDGEVQTVAPKRGVSIQRYKGLGEMNPEQLWETTMNPANRILKQVRIDDAEEADATFTMLMGDEVPPRKHFIQNNAKVATLDV